VQPLIQSFLTLDGPLDPLHYSYYSNISGFFNGDTHFYNLSLPPSTSPWKIYADSLMEKRDKNPLWDRLGTWDWNSTNRISMMFSDKLPPRSKKPVSDDIALLQVCIHRTYLPMMCSPPITKGKLRASQSQNCNGSITSATRRSFYQQRLVVWVC
jgi:hypothetical protein